MDRGYGRAEPSRSKAGVDLGWGWGIDQDWARVEIQGW